MRKEDFIITVKKVKKIKNILLEKGFTRPEIGNFWQKMTDLIPAIANAKKIGKQIKICTGCGTLNIEKSYYLPQTTCCPDANYINVEENQKP